MFAANELRFEFVEGRDGMRVEIKETTAESPFEGVAELPGQEVVEDRVDCAAQKIQNS